jgi:hypothetical protein
METEAYHIGFVFLAEVWEKVTRKEPEREVPSFGISVSIFSLNARFGREFQLQKGVNDVIVLVSVFSPPVCLKVGRTKAEGCLFVDARDDNFFSACVSFLRGGAGWG